ncbi:MAG: hypothetical protein WC364_04235 [Eubacteriales bacterium]
MKIEIIRVYSESGDEWETAAEFLLDFFTRLGLTCTEKNNGGP